MLTESQNKYLAGIPKDARTNIQPWDEQAAQFTKNLIKQLETNSLEVFWEGSLALGIPGQNDIDLYLFSEPENFTKHLPEVILILGEPTYKLEDKILWRTIKNGYKIDATLGSKNLEGVQNDIFFFNSLKKNFSLLQEYKALKEGELSAREYYQRKNEFYNRVIASK